MKAIFMHFTIHLLVFTTILSSCNRTNTSQPSTTITPTSAETLMPLPTLTPTMIPTSEPNETIIPQPVNLTGTIYLSSGSDTKPFISSVEVRHRDYEKLIGKSDTDANGVYKIENIDSGTYELWVFITSEDKMISGCNDVMAPDDKWKTGIKFSGDIGMSLENNIYLSKAILAVKNLKSSSLKVQAFFAVLDPFIIEPGLENKMDITLRCE